MSTMTLLARTTRAEWSRIWSVRSSWIVAGVTALVVVGFGAIVGYETSGDPSAVSPGSTAWDGGQLSAMFALFGILTLSVVAVTADYGTGGIVPTLQWTPRRDVLLAARSAAIVLASGLLGVALVAAASVVVWSFLPRFGLPAADGAAVLGALAFVFASGSLMAVGLGLLVRSTAGSLVVVIALVMALPLLLAQLGYAWATALAAHLPGAGALFLVFGEGPSDDMTTASARATLAAWALAATAAGGWRLIGTDARR